MKLLNIAKYISAYPSRIYRLFSVKHHSEIVWKELIKLHKQQKWSFGQYENEKLLKTTFVDDNNTVLPFHYQITDNKLILSALVLTQFDEESTNDIMLLASHLNNLLDFGVVKINIEENYVEFVYSEHLLVYVLYPGEIHSDLSIHYQIATECIWAYSHMLNNGEEPVFVISELLKRNKKMNQ